jgi:type IV pilus assembly protein PilB
MLKRRKIGELLVETGLLTSRQLEQALLTQEKSGERLGKVLIRLGYVRERDIIEVLEFQLGIPYMELSGITIEKEAAITIPVQIAERYKVIPIKKEKGKLWLAMVDPTNFFAIDDVRMLSGCEIEPIIATENDIVCAIRQYYGVSELVEKAMSQLCLEETIHGAQIQLIDDAPIVTIVNSLISQAIKEQASDIHIEPQEKDVRVRFRLDGMLRNVISFPKHTHPAIVSRIKIMSGMNIAEKRVPQDGRIKIEENESEVDIRSSTLPTIRGEKIVMRILDQKSVVLDLNGLGFSNDNSEKFKKLYTHSYGMILVTGPTGSGKTTTLYSTLTAINAIDKNIITVEDPVEYLLAGINQVQVNQKAGMNFANSLRSILRQDPNIVMVGEIRDSETADIAIRAALTGHLVFSTLHTNDAPGAIARLSDMGIEPYLIASSVLGVVAQRLVRVICPQCKERYPLPTDAEERLFLKAEPREEIFLYHGKGCQYCNHTGYHGRMAIHEIMPVTLLMRELINKHVPGDQLVAAAIQEGMSSMAQDGIRKAIEGYTSITEVMRVAYSEI